MVRLFGKKKKEEENKGQPTTSPVGTPTNLPTSTIPGQTSAASGPGNQRPGRPENIEQKNSLGFTGKDADSPLAKILQSWAKDMKDNPEQNVRPAGTPPVQATQEWVSPRNVPPSRAMTIEPGKEAARGVGDRAEEDWDEAEDEEETVAPKPKKPATAPKVKEPVLEKKPSPSPAVSLKKEAEVEKKKEPAKEKESKKGEKIQETTVTDDKALADSLSELKRFDLGLNLGSDDSWAKLMAETEAALSAGKEKEKEFEKPIPPKIERKEPEKEKEPKKEVVEKKDSGKKEDRKKNVRGFEHIFELAQGNLETSGVVIVGGPNGSGKTSVCLGLIDRYLKQGSPCIFVSYSQAPSRVREELKKMGCDAADYENRFRFMIVDGYTAQTGGFSLETYSLWEPFDLGRVQESIVGNCQIFMGEKVRVVLDSIDVLAGKSPSKEFVKGFTELSGKLKDTGATFVVSTDLSSLGKESREGLEDSADCVIVLEVEDGKEHSLKVKKLKGGSVKMEPENFELDSGKLVFV